MQQGLVDSPTWWKTLDFTCKKYINGRRSELTLVAEGLAAKPVIDIKAGNSNLNWTPFSSCSAKTESYPGALG
jgi:hypothetical protein